MASPAMQIRPPPDSTGLNSLTTTFRSTKLDSPGGERAASPRLLPLCRNVALHGSCKFENGGCRFTHTAGAPCETVTNAPIIQSPKLPPTSLLTKDAPVFVPASRSGSPGLGHPNTPAFVARLTPAAPPFQPSNGASLASASVNFEKESNLKLALPISTPMQPQQAVDETVDQSEHSVRDKGNYEKTAMDPGASLFQPAMTGYSSETPYSATAMTPHAHNPYAPFDPHLEAGYANADGYGMGVAPSMSNYRQPLNYHLYAPSLPHVSNNHPQQALLNSFFIPTSLRETLQKQSEAILQAPTHQVTKSPNDLGMYHSLVVLSTPSAPSSGPSATSPIAPPTYSMFGYPTWIYKACCTLDGKAYVLLRIEGAKLTDGKSGESGTAKGKASLAIQEAGRWRKVRHPGVVSVREAFSTRAFGDSSLVFVYDYHPMSETLLEAHLTPKPPIRDPQNGRFRPQTTSVNEQVLWSYLVQIANAIKAVHGAGFAVRTIQPSKVLLTGQNRVRLNGCAVMDVLTYDGGQRLFERQQEDFIALGQLLCAVGCTSLSSPNNLVKAIETLGRNYSSDFRDVVVWLLQPPSPQKSIQALTEILSARIGDELTKALSGQDLMESYLMRELENGRLVRLMAKFGFINERYEFDHDPRWSETGDRYLIKLFRDYVFHQVDEMGRPVTDLSHVITCLNKLDASVDEQILLVSRNEQTCMVVSYTDIRRCVDAAFRDLTKR